jgi:hypothetical protein
LGTQHCYLKDFYSLKLGISARRTGVFDAEVKRVSRSTSEVAGAKQYNTAAKNWAALIADARQNNHQFQDLWEEHKRCCQSSPLVQYLRDGDMLRTVTLLTRLPSGTQKDGISLQALPTPGSSTQTNKHFSNALMRSFMNRQMSSRSSMGSFASKPQSAKDVVAGCPISQDLRLEVYRYFKKLTIDPTLGLKWRKWHAKPIDGRNMWNPELAEALSLRIRKKAEKQEGKGRDVILFTQQEWEAFGIKKLPVGSFVKSGDMYFMPDNPKEKRKSYRQLILLETL